MTIYAIVGERAMLYTVYKRRKALAIGDEIEVRPFVMRAGRWLPARVVDIVQGRQQAIYSLVLL